MSAMTADTIEGFTLEGVDARILWRLRHDALRAVEGLVRVDLAAGSRSLRGPRPKNDDFCIRSMRGDFFALSDGIGGAPNGGVISHIACRTAVKAHDEGLDIWDSFARASLAAYEVAEGLGEGDGATLLLAERVGRRLVVLSVGDTRAYRYRDGRLTQLSPDGRADPSMGGQYNTLAKCVGTASRDVQPDACSMMLGEGDRIVLCTDGVWEPLGEEGLRSALAAVQDEGNAFRLADSLCAAAVSAAGPRGDNATCFCLVVGGVEYTGAAGLTDARVNAVARGACCHLSELLPPTRPIGETGSVEDFAATLELLADHPARFGDGSVDAQYALGLLCQRLEPTSASPAKAGCASVESRAPVAPRPASQTESPPQDDGSTSGGDPVRSAPEDAGPRAPERARTAAHWYGRAAKAGLACAQNNLAVLYVGDHRYAEARELFRRARHASPQAQLNLARMHECGLGAAPDYRTACILYREACAPIAAEPLVNTDGPGTRHEGKTPTLPPNRAVGADLPPSWGENRQPPLRSGGGDHTSEGRFRSRAIRP